MTGQEEQANKSDQERGKLSGFALLGQRYRNLSKAIKVMDRLVLDNFVHKIKPSDNHLKQLEEAKQHVQKDLGMQSYGMTDDQIKLGSLLYFEFMNFVKNNPSQTESGRGIDMDISTTLRFMDLYIEQFGALTPEKLGEEVQQKYEFEINPATIRKTDLETSEDVRLKLITKQMADIDYKTAVENAHILDIVSRDMQKTYPYQIHYLTGLEKLLDPMFQKADFQFKALPTL